MGHRSLAVGIVGAMLLGLPAFAVETAPPPREVTGGPEVRGHRLTLTAPPRLPFGRYLDVSLTSSQRAEGPPYVRFAWDGRFKTVTLELTTDRGEAVPFAHELQAHGGSLTGEFASARLRPTGNFARGPYLAPGSYRLRAIVDAGKDPFDPIRWLGRLESNAAAFAVVGRVPTPLTPAEARKLIADLTSDSPSKRLAAVRRVPPTTDEGVLAALVGRLADTHQVPAPFTGCMGSFERPVARAARWDAIPAQGPAAIDPLLAFVKQDAHALQRGEVADLLGRLGPDPRSFAYLRGRLAVADTHKDHSELCDVLPALGRLGTDAVPDLLRVARDPKWNDVIRRLAIEQLAHSGTDETVGPFLREALAYPDPQHQRAAAEVIEAAKLRALLPDLKRLAEDDRLEQNAGAAAMRAYVVLADLGDARALLRHLLASKSTAARARAALLLGGYGERGDVPRLLALLNDPDVSVRAHADHGLRGLADKPEGVAYDTTGYTDPKRWHDWWRNAPMPPADSGR